MKKIALVNFNHTMTQFGLVAWHDLRASDTWRPNYGDMLVCAALMQQLGDVETVPVGFGGDVPEDCDFALIRGSTYLFPKFEYEAATKTVRSARCPVAIIGLGCQNPTSDLAFLDGHEGAADFISALNEKCQSISVRGDFTACVIERLGAENIRITGCPSLFYKRSFPPIDPSPLLASGQRRIGISTHTGLMKNIYCRAPEAARSRHADVINFAIRNSSTTALFEQGVLMEYAMADRTTSFETRVEAAEGVLDRIDGRRFLTVEDLLVRMISVESVEEWLAKARDLDGMIGFRFHGNMVGLIQGVPAYYYTYDSRLKEFCDLYKLPCSDVEDAWTDPIRAMLDHDWQATRSQFRSCLSEMIQCYDENHVPHDLKEDTTKA
ncbi:MAG: polysaccharide pyruvyl transferase family protein [Pseudomonadota bacterium]